MMLNPIDYSIAKFVSFINPDTDSEISKLAQRRTYKKGEVIEYRGGLVDHFYIVRKGLIQIGFHGSDGSRFNLTRLGPGHTFGEVAYFLGRKTIHDTHAETDVTLDKLSRDAIDTLMTQHIEFSKAIISVSSMRLETTLSHMGDMVNVPLEARIAKFILSVSEGVNDADEIKLRQIDISHALGVSRVSIGKHLKHLSERALIRIGYGKLEILAREDLVILSRKAERKI